MSATTHIHHVEPQMPTGLAEAYKKAQTRLRSSPAVGYSDQYHPLAQLVAQGKHFGGAQLVAALDACVAVANADEPALARMAQWKRAAPDMPNGSEMAASRHAANVATMRQSADMADALTRPRVTLREQLSAMESRGIRISVSGRHLKVHAPEGVMTEGDRTLLREHKAEIIGWLAGNEETF